MVFRPQLAPRWAEHPRCRAHRRSNVHPQFQHVLVRTMSRLLDKRCRALTLGMITAGLCVASFAHAQEEKESVSLGVDPALGLDPSLPQSGALPAGQVLRTGEAPGTDWR